ncbi:MAG: B12-binding domain-containing radical SAM protein [Phycisphaerae bacterium]
MKEKVILVNAPTRTAGGRKQEAGAHLGLLYLGTVLRQNGIPITIIDMRSGTSCIESLSAEVNKADRCLVGFTCDTDNIHRVVRLSDELMQRHTDLTVVLGGPHVTCQDEPYITERRCVVRGEGEFALLTLARYVLYGQGSLISVPGLTYQHQGKIVRNALSLGPYQDVDRIPAPDYSLLESRDEYHPSLITARGCMYNCYFCSEGRGRHPYRPRSIENVERELETIRDFHGDVRYMSFNDDTFTASHTRVKKLCEAINRVFPDKRQYGFFCEGRVNVLDRHPELLWHLKEAGMLRLQIGIESGDQRMLDRINKATRVAQIENVVRKADAAGVPTVFGVFICGLPGQTPEGFKREIEFALRLIDLAPGRLELEASILTPMPGTEFGINAHKWGLKLRDDQYACGFTTEDCLCETEQMPRCVIEEMVELFRSEVTKQISDIAGSFPPARLREIFRLAVEHPVLPFTVRLLCRSQPVAWLLTYLRRRDHRFLAELNARQAAFAAPIRMPNNLLRVNGGFVVNEGTLKAFHLTAGESAYYEYFCGKLGFYDIARRVAAQQLISPEVSLKTCVDVYQKCEDNLAALMML